MIRQSKTTIKELSAQYRSVLKRAFLASFIAMTTSGAIAAGEDVTFAGNYTNADDVTVNVNDAVAPKPYSYEKSDGDMRNVASQDTDPTLTDFTYTDKNGDPATLASGTQTQADFTGTTAASGVVTTTQEIVAGATVSRDNYSYEDWNGDPVTLGTVAQDVVENIALNTTYTPETVIAVTNGAAESSFDGTLYSTTVGAETYHLSADGLSLVTSNDIIVTPDPGTPLDDEFTAMKTAYTNDVAAVTAAEGTTATHWATNQTNFGLANTAFSTDEATVATLDGYWDTYETAAELLVTAQGAQNTAQAAHTANMESAADALAIYDAPITTSITNGANAAIAASITNENGAIKTALNTAETNAKDYADGLASNYDAAGAADTAEQNAKDYADGLAANYDAAGAASTAKGEAIDSANGYTDGKIATEVDNRNAAIATAKGEAIDSAKDYTDGQIETLWGAASDVFDEKQEWVDETLGITSAHADAVNEALTGTIAGEQTTFAGAINALDGAVVAEEDRAKGVEAGLNTAIEDEIARATVAEADLSAAIATAKGEAIDSANAYTDNTALAIRNDFASGDTLTLAKANAYTDERVNELEKDMSSGIASATALSAVSVPNVKKGQLAVSGGYGYYNSQSAFALGAAVGLTSKWSANVGAALSDRNATFRAGTSYLIDLF